MLYHKDSKLSYLDICEWIDTNAYKDDVDDSILFEYLYYLFEMIGRNGKYFYNFQELDEYAVFSATKLFYRYKTINGKYNNHKKLDEIKSVLRYVKTVSYPYKVLFLKELEVITS